MMNSQAAQGASQQNGSMNQMMQMMMQMMQQMQNNNANAAAQAPAAPATQPAQQAQPIQRKRKPRIDGSSFGTGVLTHMWIGTALQPDNQGRKNNYAYMCVRDELKPLKKVYFTVFDEQLCAAATPFKSENPDPAFEGGSEAHPSLYEVDLTEMRNDPVAREELLPYDKMPGFVMMNLPLRKGKCFLNDDNGKPVTSKRTNTYVIRDHVNVMGVVDYAEVEEDGNLTYHYIKGYDAEEQRDQLEDQFYRKAVDGKLQQQVRQQQLKDPLTAQQDLGNQPGAEINQADATMAPGDYEF